MSTIQSQQIIVYYSLIKISNIWQNLPHYSPMDELIRLRAPHGTPRMAKIVVARAAMSCATAAISKAMLAGFILSSFGPARDARDEEPPA